VGAFVRSFVADRQAESLNIEGKKQLLLLERVLVKLQDLVCSDQTTLLSKAVRPASRSRLQGNLKN
jgi:hypothetical protein